MGAKSSPARSQEARANAKADRRSGGPAGAPCRAHQEGLPKVWAEICSQPNQSATSGSFFGTKYWKCAESDDGNPKKSMILHRMVPSDSAKSVLIDLPVPPRPKQRVLAPLQDAGGAAGCRRPGLEMESVSQIAMYRRSCCRGSARVYPSTVGRSVILYVTSLGRPSTPPSGKRAE